MEAEEYKFLNGKLTKEIQRLKEEKNSSTKSRKGKLKLTKEAKEEKGRKVAGWIE